MATVDDRMKALALEVADVITQLDKKYATLLNVGSGSGGGVSSSGSAMTIWPVTAGASHLTLTSAKTKDLAVYARDGRLMQLTGTDPTSAAAWTLIAVTHELLDDVLNYGGVPDWTGYPGTGGTGTSATAALRAACAANAIASTFDRPRAIRMGDGDWILDAIDGHNAPSATLPPYQGLYVGNGNLAIRYPTGDPTSNVGKWCGMLLSQGAFVELGATTVYPVGTAPATTLTGAIHDAFRMWSTDNNNNGGHIGGIGNGSQIRGFNNGAAIRCCGAWMVAIRKLLLQSTLLGIVHGWWDTGVDVNGNTLDAFGFDRSTLGTIDPAAAQGGRPSTDIWIHKVNWQQLFDKFVIGGASGTRKQTSMEKCIATSPNVVNEIYANTDPNKLNYRSRGPEIDITASIWEGRAGVVAQFTGYERIGLHVGMEELGKTSTGADGGIIELYQNVGLVELRGRMYQQQDRTVPVDASTMALASADQIFTIKAPGALLESIQRRTNGGTAGAYSITADSTQGGCQFLAVPGFRVVSKVATMRLANQAAYDWDVSGLAVAVSSGNGFKDLVRGPMYWGAAARRPSVTLDVGDLEAASTTSVPSKSPTLTGVNGWALDAAAQEAVQGLLSPPPAEGWSQYVVTAKVSNAGAGTGAHVLQLATAPLIEGAVPAYTASAAVTTTAAAQGVVQTVTLTGTGVLTLPTTADRVALLLTRIADSANDTLPNDLVIHSITATRVG